MTDIEKAVKLLRSGEYTCVLCRGDEAHTSSQKGISPMLDFIDGGVALEGFSAADKIVGKAAAMLFALAGIVRVHAEVLSEKAVPILERYNIPYTYDTKTEGIINRQGNGSCPMEQTVGDIEDLLTAFHTLKAKRAELRGF